MNYGRVIVFGAHPDDELRMAAAMARMAADGALVTAVIFTDGSEGYPDPSLKESIVEMRARESRDACRVLGIDRYINLGAQDMALENSKNMLKKVIGIIRDIRPEAIFTHGENERHRDHIATHELTVEASWHAGEPVAAELGKPWKTPHLYYYKNTALKGPVVEYDVTEFAYKRPETLATQISQHVLFGRDRESFLDEAARLKSNPERTVARFVMHPGTTLRGFPQLRETGD